jgi:hypothetical protein
MPKVISHLCKNLQKRDSSINKIVDMSICFNGATAPSGPEPPHCRDFTITLWHTTVDTTPTYKRSVLDLYLTTHNTHKRQTSMPPAGLEPAIPASEWPQTHAMAQPLVSAFHMLLVHLSTGSRWLTHFQRKHGCHCTGINKHFHNPMKKRRLTQDTSFWKMLTILM